MPFILRRHAGLGPASTVQQVPQLQEARHRRPRTKSGVTVVLAGTLALLPLPSIADSNLPPARLAYTQLPDPKQEAAAKALMEQIRCLVCQGQSIADSDAELAGDMRALIRQRIQAGEQPKAIRAWMIQRYGDYVTYDPPFDWATAPLWIAPLVLIAGGTLIAARSFRRRRA